MSATSTKGYWRVPERVKASAMWGHVHVDLRQAAIETPVVDIQAKAVMGGVTVTVPQGVLVEMRGGIFMGGAHNRVRADDVPRDAPLIRVRACGLWGAVMVRDPSSRSHHDLHEQRRAARERAREAAQDATDQAVEAMGGGPGDRERHPRGPSGSPRSRRRDGEPVLNGQDPAPARPQIPPGTLTMLVSDIAGSTRLATQLGDQRWLEVLQTHNAIVRGRVAERGGTEVKAQGDGFLFVFPSARSAVLSAIDIQCALASHRTDHPDLAVDVRVGLHTGEVVATDDDVFGQNVVVASRIADVARAGEIVVSGVTRDLTASASDLGFDDGYEVELKGITQPCRVHHVRWTAPGDGAAAPADQPS
jgi:class 3 adenylate cyclase